MLISNHAVTTNAVQSIEREVIHPQTKSDLWENREVKIILKREMSNKEIAVFAVTFSIMLGVILFMSSKIDRLSERNFNNFNTDFFKN